MYTWGDARKQPYGLPNHHAVSATEVKAVDDLGKVYKCEWIGMLIHSVAAGQSMVLAAVELN